jgi:hypothetical protein
MNKAGNFFKSFIPILLVFIIQIAVTIPVMIIYGIRTMTENSGDIEALFQSLMSATSNQTVTQTINIAYGICALIIFGIWYQKIFVKPFRNKPKHYPTGFSFHTIVAIIFLATGLQYVCTLVVDLIGMVQPAWITQYNALMETAGYSDASLILIVYTVLVAPIAEELIFRGLTFRYARHALPFWLANIWQALLFGVLHMNLVQGIYAFSIGLFLGWVCHRGRGIKYSILVHIVFNIFGCFFSDLIELSTALCYPLFIGLGIALTIFAIWLFYTDFESASSR